MKNLFRLLLLLSCQMLIAQQSTEKWNDLYNRYEYYNSQNYMTGYKQWNSLRGQWEYFSTENSSSGYKAGNTFKDENFDLLERTMNRKQNQYDYNKKRIQQNIQMSLRDLFKIDPSGEKSNKFIKQYVEELNSKKYDYSRNSTTESISNWLLEGYEKILNED